MTRTITTYIGSEESAYTSAGGGHSGSMRRGRVWFPDGKIRAVTIGVADTFFSLPAHARVRGHYVSGFVTAVDDSNRPSHAPVEYEFRPYSSYYTASYPGQPGHWAWES